MSKLLVDQVTKTFRRGDQELKVLGSVSLTIADGEILSVLGPSGCGKTTLLRIIAGLEEPDSGRVQVRNASNGSLPIVWQDTRLFPWLTVWDNVALGLKARKTTRHEIQIRVSRALSQQHLSSFADFYPHQLSGGMKQRAALARALVLEPPLLLLDEPFSSLDYQTKLLIQDEVVKLHREIQVAILYVTHNIRDAIRLGHRIILLSARPARVLLDLDVHSADHSPEMETKIWDILRTQITPA